MVSKRDLDSAELETIRTSRRPTAVMTANSEVQTREEATVYVKELDFFRDSYASARNSRSVFTGNSAKNMVHITVQNHISPKTARDLIAKNQTMCHS